MSASLLDILWWAAAALSLAACAYLLLAMWAVSALRLEAGRGWESPPRVTLLKPLCGDEDGLAAALASFLSQKTSSEINFVFGVADADDPALVAARLVSDKFPAAKVHFVVDPRNHGPNPKVSNLINMADSCGDLGDIVVISDSDIVIAAGVLERSIAALAAPNRGAVTALYRAIPGQTLSASRRYGAWFLDYGFLPMAVLHARLAPLSVTYGPLTAIRADVLATIGGLAVLADHLSDDAELGRLVRAAGYDIGFSPDVVETLVNDPTWAELFDHELRWARTVRGLDPLGYVASLVSHVGPLPLLLLIYPSWGSVAAMLAPVLLHYLLARMVARRLGRNAALPMPGPFALWLRDCFSFAVWARGLVARRVGWRGQRLAMAHGDILVGAK
jgi:ceramide glucosyltransferase